MNLTPSSPSQLAIHPAESGDEIRQHWVPLLEESDGDGTFEHENHDYKHIHLFWKGEPDPDDGILYVGDGAWGQGPRSVKSPDELPYLAVSETGG